jgi:hypothetical protein
VGDFLIAAIAILPVNTTTSVPAITRTLHLQARGRNPLDGH